MKKIIVLILSILILLIPTLVLSAPSISSVTGTITDGSTITVSGTGFTSHGLDIDFGKDGIEAQSVGPASDFGNWQWEQTSEILTDPNITDSVVHSGTKAIDSTVIAYENASIWRWQYSSTIGFSTDLYITWWVRKIRTGSGDGQWKMFRIMPIDSIVDSSTPQIRWFDWDSYNQFFIAPGPGSSAINSDGSPEDYLSNPWPENDNNWYRVEIRVTTCSAQGVSDGSYTVTVLDPVGDTVESHSNNSAYNTFNYTGRNYYKWLIWQNFVSNEDSSFTMRVYLDDPYVQVGTVSRIEIGDSNTYSTCTHREIMEPSAWSTTSITAKLNTGSLPNGTAYMFVIDENGDASSGYEVTIGATVSTGNTQLGSGTPIDISDPTAPSVVLF